MLRSYWTVWYLIKGGEKLFTKGDGEGLGG